MVEYEADVFILRPADPAKGSGKLLYEVTNRGNKVMFGRLQNSSAERAALNDPKSAADAGGIPLAFERGYTMVWSGWEPDLPATDHQMVIRVPSRPPVGGRSSGASATRFKSAHAGRPTSRSRGCCNPLPTRTPRRRG
jgi:hypothetical protein